MLGYSYRNLGNFDDAETAFKKYIELIPNDPNPYDSYAEMLLKQGGFILNSNNLVKHSKNYKVFMISGMSLRSGNLF